jgi:hypothetical protein
MSDATMDNCQKDLLRRGRTYGHHVMDDDVLSEWHYDDAPSLMAKQRYDNWSYHAKSQYDIDRRITRVFRWSHRPRMETPQQTIATDFKTYADKWWSETRILSSIQGKIFNQHYQRIIGMGKPVLPFIFADLKRRGGQWYWALECITGDNPAATAATLDEARSLWLEYAANNDYLPK